MSIQQKQSQQSHEAIVFFGDGAVSKEMLYQEFEALLDCVVPMREFAGRELEAAYVRLDGGLAPMAIVLFIIPFDDEGFPEQSWNIPLRQLAESGTRGPDLGGGSVRLATSSQCPIAGLEDKLWDIQFGVSGNTLNQLQECLQNNRLGLDTGDSGAHTQGWNNAPQPMQPPSVQPQQMQPSSMPQPSAAPSQDSTDAMLAMMQQSSQQLAIMKEQHQRELASLRERYAGLEEQLQILSNEKQLLSEQLGLQAEATSQERERGAQLLEQANRQAEAAAASMREALEWERDTALAERDRQMQVEVERLERERQQQEDQLLSLRTEITELRRDKLRLLGDGADKFFDDLKEKGVKFVSFQPGAGHLTIAMGDLQRFVDDTETFVAEKCGVSVEHYRKWLAHYHNPVCQGASGSGALCAKPLSKLLKPAEFVAGMHDRCDIHKQVPRSRPMAEKAV